MQIESIIAAVMRSLDPSSGDNLTGFIIDADHAFESAQHFEDVRIERTSEKHCLLEISVTATTDTPSLQQISHELSEAWVSIAYPEFQATSIMRYREATIMRFVTVGSGGVLAVTGRVTVTGNRYPFLVADFERDFGVIGSLKDLPRALYS